MLRAACCLALAVPLMACAAQPDPRFSQAAIAPPALDGSAGAAAPADGAAIPVNEPAIPSGPHEVMGSRFAVADDGTVIPDNAPDATARAYAARCAGTGPGAAVATGMSECDLIDAKGTPSRVILAADQQGGTHNAIWYVEGGERVTYRFDNDHLTTVIR